MGLWGKPVDTEDYECFVVEGEDSMRCWVQREVLERVDEYPLTEEGDHLFFVEGVGRLRWSIGEEPA